MRPFNAWLFLLEVFMTKNVFDVLKERGFIDSVTDEENLKDVLEKEKIKFYIGDALKLLPGMNITFDLAFVDGDKRKYIEYYEMVLEKLSPGGYIIADNTLWDGHVLEEPHHTDLQTIGIKKFNDLVAADKRVEKVILPLRDGLTIIKKC